MPRRPDPTQLLADLTQMGSYGRAEGEDKERFPCTFHPVAEHTRAFDPNVVLVIGPRGAGKSELFRAVIEMGLLPAIRRCLPGVRLPSAVLDRTRWVAGYPIGRDFPDARGLSLFLQKQRARPNASIELWFAYLIRVLWDELAEEDRRALAALRCPLGGDAKAVYDAFCEADNGPLLALDCLDAKIERENRYIFIGYDELDVLGAKDWNVMSEGIRGLVAFWATYTRRWQRIRAKIFLRSDLFQRYATAGGPDLAKLASNRVELVWSDRNLYAMLLKRIVNTSDELCQYVKSVHGKIEFYQDSDLGYVPRLIHSEDVRPFIERMVGTYMGANFKKGLAYRWLLNHIRDGRGQALPRPLVRMVEVAAELQRNSSRVPQWPKLLDPTSLRRALDRVSEEHVQHSLDEWPWLRGLKARIRDEQVPWERRQLERLLDNCWQIAGGEGDAARPPADTPHEFVDYLVEVGIFRARFDGRIDVPDLFLAGLGLKRKGGVRKK